MSNKLRPIWVGLATSSRAVKIDEWNFKIHLLTGGFDDFFGNGNSESVSVHQHYNKQNCE